MRAASFALALSLIPSIIFAQSMQSATPASPARTVASPEELAAMKERVSFWLKTCLEDWDTATHMSRKEWEVTCQRVASERGRFLLQNPDTFSMPGPKPRQR